MVYLTLYFSLGVLVQPLMEVIRVYCLWDGGLCWCGGEGARVSRGGGLRARKGRGGGAGSGGIFLLGGQKGLRCLHVHVHVCVCVCAFVRVTLYQEFTWCYPPPRTCLCACVCMCGMYMYSMRHVCVGKYKCVGMCARERG